MVACFKLADHHNLINIYILDTEYKMIITSVFGFLTCQLICNFSSLLPSNNPVPQELISLGCTKNTAEVTISYLSLEPASSLASGGEKKKAR